MKIAIIGAGAMGQWLIRQLAKEHELAVYDTELVDQICRDRVAWFTDLAELKAFQPDLLINAVNLQKTRAVFEEVAPLLPSDCVLADITSVKDGLAECYQKLGRRFVSIHPLFGPTFANIDALREENAIIIKESDPKAKEFFVTFFARLGVKLYEFTFKEHDSMMAYSLTTPFVATLVFASCVNKTAVPGTTFSRHMKTAKGLLAEDDHLLAEILFNEHSIKQLEQITAKLEFLKHVIADRDIEEVTTLFAQLRQNIAGSEADE